MITYLLGSYQLGRFLSSNKVYYEATAPAATTSSSPRSSTRAIGTPIPRPCTTC